MRVRIVTLLVIALPFFGSCNGSSTGPDGGGAVFVVQVIDETFHVRIVDPARIERARRILNGAEPQLIVTGRLAAGDDGVNEPWSWHLVPGTVGFAEVAIELCDGKPSFVEAELDYWLNTVQTYCPWSSRIVAELPETLRGRGD